MQPIRSLTLGIATVAASALPLTLSAAARAAPVTVTFRAGLKPNPTYVSFEPPVFGPYAAAEFQCWTSDHPLLSKEPVARITVAPGSPAPRIDAGYQRLIFREVATKKVFCERDSKLLLPDKPATYDLFIGWDDYTREKKPYLRLMDQDGPYVGEAPVAQVTITPDAAVERVEGVLSPGQHGPACHGAVGAAPDLLVTPGSGVTEIDLWIETMGVEWVQVVSRDARPENARAYAFPCVDAPEQPVLRRPKKKGEMSTGVQVVHRRLEVEGPRHLYLATSDADRGKPYRVHLVSASLEGAEWLAPVPRRVGAPLAQHELAAQFPYADQQSLHVPGELRANEAYVQNLWARVPADLAVFGAADVTSKDMGASSDEPLASLVHKGEPVLLLSLTNSRATIATLDGRVVEVNPEHLTPVPPAGIMFPKDPGGSLIGDIAESGPDAAWVFPEYRSVMTDLQKKKDTFDACMDRTLDKLDPSGRADDYDLVTQENGRVTKIESYGDKIFAQASRTCGANARDKAVSAAGKKLTLLEQARRRALLAETCALVAPRLEALPPAGSAVDTSGSGS